MHGDCLELMQKIPDGSVDMVMCDLPYGTTQNKWDSVIDLSRLWTEYKRICTGSVVLTAAQPFTSAVVSSNIADFRYQWVWCKTRAVGHLNAKKMPMNAHEDILVFRKGIYNPQGLIPYGKTNKRTTSGDNYGKAGLENYAEFTNYPNTLLTFSHDNTRVHPTQKPVQLMEYLIKTYTNEGMTVLDNCMGSGTTGVACVNTNRNFIGIERDDNYFKICEERIYDAELKQDMAKMTDLFGEVTA